MRNKYIDERIRQSLELKTSYTNSEKEDLWARIETKLTHPDIKTKAYESEKVELVANSQSSSTSSKAGRSSRKRQVWMKRIAIAATITLGLALAVVFSKTGQAMIQEVKKWLPLQKEVNQSLEGMTEQQNVKKQEVPGSIGDEKQVASYVIYIDEERYKLIRDQHESRIIPKTPLPARYPEVSMTIHQDLAISPEKMAHMIYKDLTDQYETVKPPEKVTEPLAGWKISARTGVKWDSPVITVYVTSNKINGSFIFRQTYFLEASEGHGARMFQMLKEFHIEVSEK